MAKPTNYEKHTNKNPIFNVFLSNFYRTLFKELKPLRPVKILDVGCGEGFTLFRLKQEKIGKESEGIEYVDQAIKIGKKLHPSVIIKKGTIYKLPYEDNSFDMVLCTEVLEHLENPQEALQELIRVSSKYVVISVPNEPWHTLQRLARGKYITRLGKHPEHIQNWSTKLFVSFVSPSFKTVKVKKPFPWTLVVGRKKTR